MNRLLVLLLSMLAMTACSSTYPVDSSNAVAIHSESLAPESLTLPESEPLLVVISKDESIVDKTPPVVAVVWAGGEYLLHRCWPSHRETRGLYFGRVSKPVVDLFVRDLTSLPLSKIDKAYEVLPSHSYFTIRINLDSKNRVETKSKWWPQYSAYITAQPWPEMWDFRSVIGSMDGLLRGLDSMKAARLPDDSAERVSNALRLYMLDQEKWQGLVIKGNKQ